MSATAQFRTGLVGAGYISDHHVAALRRLPNVELVGVFDVVADRAEALARKHGTRAFGSQAAIRDAGANVIHVLTPPHTHAAVALEAIDLGCHVLVEKPLATDAADCRRIEDAARRAGVRVCVNHSLLCDPQVQRALLLVKQGKLGRIVSVDILRSSRYPAYAGGPLPPQYRSAGYPFRDLCIHALYLFEAFLGAIENVDAQWRSLGGDPNLAFDEWRALVRCRNGLGQFQLSWNVEPLQSQVLIHGTRGVLRLDLFLMFQNLRRKLPLPGPALRIVNALSDAAAPLLQVPLNVARFAIGRIRPYQGLHELVANFYRALGEGEPVPVSVADAVNVVDWTERVARAADEDHARRLASVRTSRNASVLVTGASGALGSEVVSRLRNDGQRVRVMVRRLPDDPPPQDVDVVVGDLGDLEAVRRAVDGVEVVIHCGAAMKGGRAHHQCATVLGTANVLQACREQGVARLVHISSLSVLDWAGAAAGQPLHEDSPLEPHPQARGHYTRAKLEAERLVVQHAREGKVPAVILRPGQIHGGRIPLLTPALARRFAKHWVVLGDGSVRLPLVHIDQVVDAIVAAMNSDLRDGEIIHIVGDETPTQDEVLRRELGSLAHVVHIPRPIVSALGKVSEVAFALLKRPSPFSAYRLRSALARRSFPNRRAGELLDCQRTENALELATR
jgi:predicted dehydrogenase/nucleoside-diphosphate-sugar epimerase